MKRLFDEDDNEYPDFDKRKIFMTVIPFVLIIIILAVTLLVNGMKKSKGDSDDLQQSIMEYADEHKETEVSDQQEEDNVLNTEKETEETEGQKEAPIEQEEAESVPSPTPYKEVMEKGKVDYSKIEYDKDAQLKEMMAYWADNNQKALDDLANLDRFIAMSWSLKGTDDCYYYGDVDGNGQPSGKGIAVYADNQYYYGDWKNGVRSGNGTWIHYHIHQVENTTDLYTYHQYTGGWENDLPSGEGSEHYDYNTALLKEGIGYDTNLIGSYSEGLVDGEFYLTNIYSDGSTKEWNATAEHGSWVYQSENKDKKGNRTVYVNVSDPDNYIWMQPKDNVNIGVPCLISKNKN